jgi:hypothetical protein
MLASKSTISPGLAIAVIALYSGYSNEEKISKESFVFALKFALLDISEFKKYTDEQFSDLSDKALEFIEEEGAEKAYKQALKSLGHIYHKEAAMIAVLGVISVDNDVPEDKEKFLIELQELLEISDVRFDGMLVDFYGDDGNTRYDDEDED